MSTAETPTLEQLKERVRQEWTDPATVAAAREWHPKLAVQSAAATEAIAQAARLEPGMRVLDLASGSGEPALTLARLVGPAGHVTATDLGADTIAVAEENARQAGLTNMAFRQADAHELPFPDGTFDRVTCRFGAMFFADCGQALREIRRVLKPGGRIALVAMGPPEQNPWLLIALGPFLKRVAMPPPPAGAPHLFRFARPGSLGSELEAAGYVGVEEEIRTVPWPFPGSPEELWREIQGLAAPFRRVMNALPPDQKEEAVAEVLAGYRSLYDGRQVDARATIVLASGTC